MMGPRAVGVGRRRNSGLTRVRGHTHLGPKISEWLKAAH